MVGKALVAYIKAPIKESEWLRPGGIRQRLLMSYLKEGQHVLTMTPGKVSDSNPTFPRQVTFFVMGNE